MLQVAEPNRLDILTIPCSNVHDETRSVMRVYLLFACVLMMLLGLVLAFWREDVRTFGIMLVLLSALPLIGSAIFEFIKARMKF
jgi:hypothetical protein